MDDMEGVEEDEQNVNGPVINDDPMNPNGPVINDPVNPNGPVINDPENPNGPVINDDPVNLNGPVINDPVNPNGPVINDDPVNENNLVDLPEQADENMLFVRVLKAFGRLLWRNKEEVAFVCMIAAAKKLEVVWTAQRFTKFRR